VREEREGVFMVGGGARTRRERGFQGHRADFTEAMQAAIRRNISSYVTAGGTDRPHDSREWELVVADWARP